MSQSSRGTVLICGKKGVSSGDVELTSCLHLKKAQKSGNGCIVVGAVRRRKPSDS
jgi:hypothetical protein